ncbi:cell division protein, partial [Herbaspirillum frisingense]
MMMDLQTSLIILGGVFVVGVISYNKWQEHKARKTVERAFSSSHDDVLMSPDEPSAIEPVFAAPQGERAAAGSSA